MKEERKELYNQLKDEVVEVSKKYRKDVDKFKINVEDKLKNFKPSMMVYGVYNAGKSTLLNALFGKEVATVADAPETDKVEGYEYNGYTIYDTPGINAPIKHEEVTKEHLKKTELVIFVLSNDGSFEEEYIYKRISEIVKSNKPLLLAVNNKAGIGVNSLEEREIYSKIEENLEKIAKREGIDNIKEKVDICLVDALMAFQAREEEEEFLLEASNILELEKKIKEMLKNSSSENVINTLKNYIEEYIDKSIEIINKNIPDGETKEIEELISDINRLKKSTLLKVKGIIELKADSLKYELVQSLVSGAYGVESIIEATTKEIESSINREIEYSYKKLKDKLEELNVNKDVNRVHLEYNKKAPSAVKVKMPEIEEKENSILDVLTKMPIPPIITPTPNPLPPINIPMVILKTVIDIFSKKESEKNKALAELEAKKNQYMFAESKAKSFIYDYKNELIRSVENSLNETFDSVIKKIREEQKNKEDELTKDKQKLEEIKSKLV